MVVQHFLERYIVNECHVQVDDFVHRAIQVEQPYNYVNYLDQNLENDKNLHYFYE